MKITKICVHKKKVIGLIHKTYLAESKNIREYLASTKTKSEVSGGGRKPWKQKGTGHARAGSTRSPLWKGGGVTFGPIPRIVNKKINTKEKKVAIQGALYIKKENIFIINKFLNIYDINITKLKKFLINFNFCINEKILIVIPTNKHNEIDKTFQNVKFTLANSINLHDIIHSKNIIFLNNTLSKLFKTYEQKRKYI